ncbi:uncharacterized protein [Drosophila virilis]|uniref:Uncharacterized protein n=1 Tax=Drosophila virilis TaxID=7244 RepID=A0A0Q9W247_DROVI|nr:uncharacterized protein LOC26531003 [Drosophila virilis]KRF79148.1 uncharacterized protein Dvir_GJ26233 [Drosophila virilis]
MQIKGEITHKRNFPNTFGIFPRTPTHTSTHAHTHARTMNSLQAGDACVECLSQGLNHKLRYFYLNLEEQLLKCESRNCLWPHNDAVSTSSSSSSCSDVAEGETQSQSTHVDDDEFIKQLLEQLATGNDSTHLETSDTKPNAAAYSCDSNLMPNATSNDCSIEDILSMPNHWQSAQQLLCGANAVNSRRNTFNLEQCDKLSPVAAATKATTTTTAHSMPDLLTEPVCITELLSSPPNAPAPAASSKTEPAFELSAKAGNIVYTISIPQSMPKPKSPTAKRNIFQMAPSKASTQVRKHQEQLSQVASSTAVTTPTQTASLFLDALKRPSTMTLATRRAPRGRNLKRRENAPSGGARWRIQDVKQTLERIEAVSRQKGSKTESESELETEPELEQEANAKQIH